MRLINRGPAAKTAWIVGALPFLLVVLIYVTASTARLAENANDKLLPSIANISTAIERLAFEPSKRTGEYLFWEDTGASVRRLGIGIFLSAMISLVIGVSVGSLPWMGGVLSPFVRAVSMIPPMAILPILFIVFGLGEVAKVVLIVIGTAPFLIRDLEKRVLELPREQLIKAQTLGASTWQIIVRVILPQVLPRLIDGLRLTLGSAWLFLIAAEAIAATEGLGYRIFLVRRYLSMDVILPYVLWITFLAFLFDVGLRSVNRKLFPWYQA